LSVLSLRPKSAEQCIELQNSADRRLWPVARYAYQLREMDWDFKLQWPFEVFCSQALALCLPASKVSLSAHRGRPVANVKPPFFELRFALAFPVKDLGRG
jgi:hypothetical protein